MSNNPYRKTVWVPHIVEVDEFGNPVIDPATGKQVVLSEGTRFTAGRGNNIEDGIYNLYDLVAEQDRINQRQEVKFLLMDRSSSGNVFYDTMDGQAASKAALDTTSSNIKTSTLVGATVLQVDTTNEFTAFTEVTIYDDVNYEDTIITAIDTVAKTITVQALTNAYKKGANIARSNVVIDATNNKMHIGSWGTYSITATEM